MPVERDHAKALVLVVIGVETAAGRADKVDPVTVEDKAVDMVVAEKDRLDVALP